PPGPILASSHLPAFVAPHDLPSFPTRRSSDLLTNGVRVLLENPDQLALLREGKVEWSTAVEEVLRHSTSVAALPFLFAVEDVQIGDLTVKAGEPILLAFLAANLDLEDRKSTRLNSSHVSISYAV